MRFIGGKSLLLDEIINVIKTNTKNVNSVIDIFSGSGVVSQRLKLEGYSTLSNDFLYFSYILNRGTIALNTLPTFDKLDIKNPIEYLNSLTIDDTDIELEKCFIYNNYSPNE